MIGISANSICGIDEVGRGSLAGPLVAAGVLLTPLARKILINSRCKIRDSKKLTPTDRNITVSILEKTDAKIYHSSISVSYINSRGIQEANYEAVRRVIKNIEAQSFIVDGNLKPERLYKTKHVESLIKGDSQILEIMLASIVAKVYRDTYMEKLHKTYPNYAWIHNKGYGTRTHIEAIQAFGATKHHRNSFIYNFLT